MLTPKMGKENQLVWNLGKLSALKTGSLQVNTAPGDNLCSMLYLLIFSQSLK